MPGGRYRVYSSLESPSAARAKDIATEADAGAKPFPPVSRPANPAQVRSKAIPTGLGYLGHEPSGANFSTPLNPKIRGFNMFPLEVRRTPIWRRSQAGSAMARFYRRGRARGDLCREAPLRCEVVDTSPIDGPQYRQLTALTFFAHTYSRLSIALLRSGVPPCERRVCEGETVDRAAGSAALASGFAAFGCLLGQRRPALIRQREGPSWQDSDASTA